ncbi:MAG TPA: DUF3772 domain-containing protein [Dyella sp.]|uniref:mechanosensitive ion channel family protein n=1 Tax=Dyella sp. TaxID=1869338 RepID=UPI002F9414F8
MPLLQRLLIALPLLLVAASSPAQDLPAPASSASAPPTVDQLQDQLTGIEQTINDKDTKLGDSQFGELRGKALAVQQEAGQLADNLKPQSEGIKAKLDVLGPPPAKGAPPEPADLAQQRKELTRAQSDIDGQIKQAIVLAQTGGQVANRIAGLQRDAFEAELSQRIATPFSRSFWSTLSTDLPSDMRELRLLGADIGSSLQQAWQAPNRLPFVLFLLLAVALVIGRRYIEAFVLKVASTRLPNGHLRRSALATLIVLITTLCAGFAAYCIFQSLNWNGLLDDDVANFLHSLVRLTCFAAYVTGLGRALLSVKRPSWRMPTLSDDTAQHLSPFPWLLAAVGFLLGTVNRINQDIGAGLAAVVTTNGILSLIISTLIAAVLLRLGQARRAMLAAGDTPARRPLWVGLMIAAAFAGVVLCWLAVATGYFALSLAIARQMLWTAVIVTSLYLFSHLINDLFETLFAPHERSGQRMQEAFGVPSERLEQTATILSGVARAFLLLFAISLLFSRYGAGPGELMARVNQLFTGASLGSLPIVPSDIFEALLVVLVGMIAVRTIKQWLSGQLLPKTTLELGMQNSIVTLLGYVGGIVVFVLALAALKVNLQSIAWVASALSVGIGFGLQAIVQNFISGLILLAERPVKVGDWVSLGGGVEGDIRRINVRATEIQMGDRSTMIVPNSQFISQNVRNVTLGHAQGRVQLQLSLPLSTDADNARKIVLDVFRNHPSTLETPAPSVTLDNLDGGTMTFVCTGYVKSPRDAGGVKSDILFELLRKLRAADMPLSSPQDMVIHTVRQTVAKADVPTVVSDGNEGDDKKP